MNTKNEYRPPFGIDITHPGIRLIYVLLGVVIIWNHFVDDLQTVGDLIRTIAFSGVFLMLALFAPQMARRAQQKRMENPDPWAQIARHPLRALLSNVTCVVLLAVVFAYDLLVIDSIHTWIVVLSGGVSLFLWSFIFALLRDRCNPVLRALWASPFFVGFGYAFCRLGYLNDQLSNPETTFPWPLFAGLCVMGIGVPLLIARQRQQDVEPVAETDNTDSPSEIDSNSVLTDAPGND